MRDIYVCEIQIYIYIYTRDLWSLGHFTLEMYATYIYIHETYEQNMSVLSLSHFTLTLLSKYMRDMYLYEFK